MALGWLKSSEPLWIPSPHGVRDLERIKRLPVERLTVRPRLRPYVGELLVADLNNSVGAPAALKNAGLMALQQSVRAVGDRPRTPAGTLTLHGQASKVRR